ncbi:SDR family NAD(P)-dependent oxidoreductase [Pseudofrankia inefficax]|uniref:Short-chain dehydrogenase/reductase SDR n=1 Tax=Pseudofrankia inefficax (strain DSM 45817 / CECT 9037 / DDB 130130 / EuI1c) TaxID=298654 RepID=E3J7R8_PSEI1|nr:SDR family NAD(P)-dependent oxidoreductase [Pseudofrankia inefficax]ADP80822.1 short-chain dehydrogenase/reductase SDR [Pseudofrankia inefficax]
MGKLEGKVAIVTGGAGGIGTGTCRLLAREGAAVVVADIPQAKPSALAEELTQAGQRAIAVEVDISDEAQVEGMVRAALDAFGRLDGLHANAAATHLVARDGLLTELSRADLEEAFQVNVVGTWLCCKHAIPAMIETGGGSIVGTSSAAATHADTNKTAYGITKASVGQLMRTVATQFGKQGIRANTILPGLIMHHRVTRMGEDFKKIIRANVLTPEFGDADSIGSLVAYLFSDDARYLQGQEIRVDGGMFAHSVQFAWEQPESTSS